MLNVDLSWTSFLYNNPIFPWSTFWQNELEHELQFFIYAPTLLAVFNYEYNWDIVGVYFLSAKLIKLKLGQHGGYC